MVDNWAIGREGWDWPKVLAYVANFPASPQGPADLLGADRLARWSPWMLLLCMFQPVISATFRADGAHRWAQDIDAIRTLGLGQVGAEHIVSSAFSAVFTIIPLGSRWFRAGLPNLLLLALAGALIYRLSLQLLGGRSPRFRDGLLAAAAALTVTNSVPWQLSATQLGGPIFAAVLVVLLGWQLRDPPKQSWLVRGLLLGLLLVESRGACLAALVLLASQCAVNTRLPRLGAVLLGAGTMAATASFCLLPSLVGPVGASGFGRMGLSLALPRGPDQAIDGILGDAGYYFLGLAAVGSLVVALRPRLRVRLLPWGAILPLHWLADDGELGLLTMLVVGVFASAGLHALGEAARVSRLPMRAQTSHLAALFHLGALLMLAEDARDAHRSRAVSGTAEWSEQAFSRLPARSLLITHTPGAAWRLWAERVSSGTRPDVLLVPQALLAQGALAQELLAVEPALGGVVRDLALEGRVSEYALSSLADERPVRAELDPKWDRRLLGHCVPDGLWFRFLPHEMGRSDRKRGLRSAVSALKSVRRASVASFGRDADTIARLRSDGRQQLLAATALRDRRNAQMLLRQLRRLQLEPDDAARFAEAIESNSGLASVQGLLPR